MIEVYAKEWKLNNLCILAQDFCSCSRRRNRRIASYVTVSTTQKTDKKTSDNA